MNSDLPRGVPEEDLIRSLFTEGLDRDVSVERMTFGFEGGVESMGTLVDGLEKMMRNRSDTTTNRDSSRQPDTRPVLKEFVVIRPRPVVLVML